MLNVAKKPCKIPVKILLMSTCMNKSMVSKQILTTVMTCLSLVVDKNTDHAKPHSICFFTTILKTTKEIFVKICWQLKTPTPTWKCTRCIMQRTIFHVTKKSKYWLIVGENRAARSSLRARLSFQKLLQTRSTCRSNKRNLFGKRVMKRTHCR